MILDLPRLACRIAIAVTLTGYGVGMQVVDALKAVGDVTLADKFQEGIVRIKRDIIFAASLYL